jgi:hypothetical protein
MTWIFWNLFRLLNCKFMNLLWKISHVHLKTMYIMLWLVKMFYQCHLVVNSIIQFSLADFLFVLFIILRRILESQCFWSLPLFSCLLCVFFSLGTLDHLFIASLIQFVIYLSGLPFTLHMPGFIELLGFVNLQFSLNLGNWLLFHSYSTLLCRGLKFHI